MNYRIIPIFLLVFLLFLIAVLVSCSDGDSGDDSSSDSQVSDDDTNDDANDDADDDINDDADDDLNDDLDDDSCDGAFYSDFQRYRQTMDEGYAYFLVKDIDWDALIEGYQDSACNNSDPDEFALSLMEIHAKLRDSHSWVWTPDLPSERYPNRRPTGVCLHRIGPEVYISKLTDEAAGAGMRLGDEVVSLDGEPVDDVLARAVHWEGCSSAQCCDFYRLPHADRFSVGEGEVEYAIRRSGQPHEMTLARSGSGGGLCKSEPLNRFLEDASGSVLQYKNIDDDIGYMHLSTLSDSASDEILADLDLALDLFGSRALIFDARYNSGGSDLVAMSVLARFLSQWISPVDFRYKLGPAHDSFTPWLPEPALPGSNSVSNRVIFLINGGCVSAADFFAAAASYVPTFELLGTTTCGGTGAPKQDTLPVSGITYSYSQMQRRYALTGEQIEGIGIAPDIFVEQDPEDLADGIDTQIMRAIELLRE
jgi:C-terminal processing protease CtpA/Prc